MLRAVGALAGLRLVGAILAVLNSFLLASQLGLVELGLYSAALAATNLLGIAAWLGFPTYMTARTATGELAGRTCQLVVGHVVVASLMVGAILFVSAGPSFEVLPIAARVLSVYVPARAALMIARGALLGLNRTRLATALGDVTPQFLVSLQLLAIGVSDSSGAAGVTAGAFLGVAVAAVLVAWRVTSTGQGVPPPSVRETYVEAIALTGTSWLRSLQENLPVLALTWISPLGPGVAGAFRLAQRGAGLAQLPVAACIAWLSPQIPRLKNEPAELGGLLQRAGSWSVGVSLAAFGVALVVAEPLIGRLLGTEFRAAVPPLLILLLANAGRHVWPYPLLVLNLSNNAQSALRVQLISVGTCVAALLVLTLLAGASGAALAVGFSWLASSWLGALACRERLGIHLRSFPALKPRRVV